jgi:acetyl-CoA carboxylase biotin carboxyl carrier protein
VAEDSTNNPNPFDIPTIRALIQMMSRHNVSEVDLRQGNQRIRLLRGGTPLIPIPSIDMTSPQMFPSASPPAGREAPQTPASKPLYEIKSPTPGTFYASPSPDAESFVKVGSRVTAETVVCLVEAMKLFTEISADVNGVIAEILVQNQQAVEYGTVLFRVDTSG